uniref:hypothetical protein n=1 Tax=Thaumasiovibrio occultus TaxID=1891184 RepID=UPI000B354D1D|nr:hypothetical protein [Thaumasiovibrio occultus]
MNKTIDNALIFAYHQRTHTPLLKAKQLLETMDSLLLERIARALDEQCDPAQFLYDPIEDTPKIKAQIAKAEKEALATLSEAHSQSMGSCHLIWRETTQILKQKHNIIWFSPAEMNPSVCFD